MQMGIPHFLCVPFPIQGHVNPLMQFSLLLAKHGCKVTFVHTEFSHKRAKTAGGADNNVIKGSQVELVTLPDGLDPEDDRTDLTKVILSINSTMPARLQKLIQDINALDVHNNITCILVTFHMGWALQVGLKLGIKGALLCPASATTLASAVCIPKLLHDGIIDSQGLPTKKQEIQLSPNMPMMDTQNFPWSGFDGKTFFDILVQEIKTLELGEWWLCNTTYDLEPGAFSVSPKLLSIGPLMGSESQKSAFWEEDTTCLDWLDKQPPQSVIYVSFGSLAVIDSNQFKELAYGLDLLDKPFIWVVRPTDKKENVNAYPDDFHGSKGKIVGWAPQKKILNHTALACFISHCGWNSTVEGIYAGVPFLCWPCSSDQYLDKSYICDVWKIGLGLDKDENGIISRGEIRKKVDQILVDEDIKAKSLKLKEMTINNTLEGGQSWKNLKFFVDWAK